MVKQKRIAVRLCSHMNQFLPRGTWNVSVPSESRLRRGVSVYGVEKKNKEAVSYSTICGTHISQTHCMRFNIIHVYLLQI